MLALATAGTGCAARSPASAGLPAPTEAPAELPPTEWDESKIGPPFLVQDFELAPRSNGVLLRDPTLRVAMEDLRRLWLVSGFQEVQLGLLRVAAGKRFAGATAVGYRFVPVYSAYRRSVDQAAQAVIEIWQDGRKLGEYTRDGFLVGAEYGVPRK